MHKGIISSGLLLALALGCDRSTTPQTPEPSSTAPAPAKPVPVPAPAPAPDPGPPPSADTSSDLYTIPTNAPTNASPCMERMNFSVEAMQALRKNAAYGCKADADCVLEGFSNGCRGACKVAVRADRAGAMREVMAEIEARVCDGYRDAKCPYATPRCMNVEARCVDQACRAKPKT